MAGGEFTDRSDALLGIRMRLQQRRSGRHRLPAGDFLEEGGGIADVAVALQHRLQRGSVGGFFLGAAERQDGQHADAAQPLLQHAVADAGEAGQRQRDGEAAAHRNDRVALPDVGDFVGQHHGQCVLAGQGVDQSLEDDDVTAQRRHCVDRVAVGVMHGQRHFRWQSHVGRQPVGERLQVVAALALAGLCRGRRQPAAEAGGKRLFLGEGDMAGKLAGEQR